MAAIAAALLLAGCGGGVSVGFGSGGGVGVGVGFVDGSDRTPPSVSPAASTTTVQAGRRLRLAAAAADESGVDSVSFLLVEGGEAVVLATLDGPPYEIDVVAPSDGRTSITVYARAIDREGNRGESGRVTIAITP